MQCIYINLDSKTNRKENIEKNFEQYKIPGWTLERFSAVDTEKLKSLPNAGSARDTEKAAFYSHKYALKSSIANNDHVMIIEDDIAFGEHTCKVFEDIISSLDPNEWDIIYGEVCIPVLDDMYKLVKMRQQLENKSAVNFDLAQVVYAGATCYVVNKKSKLNFLNLLEKNKIMNNAPDLYIRALVHQRKIKAKVIFPFVTGFSEEAADSDVRLENEKATELIWMLFRKLIGMHRNIEKEKPDLDYIANNLVDEESEAFAKIFSAMLSKKYVTK